MLMKKKAAKKCVPKIVFALDFIVKEGGREGKKKSSKTMTRSEKKMRTTA
jgi:hypothetical protein